ncbi:MAG: hypothetical protein SLRJCFUN_000403 [Candidatus Fervidibacter sp.]
MRKKEPTMFLLAAVVAVLIALALFVAMRFSLSRQPPPEDESAASATFQVVLCYPDLKNDRLVREPVVFAGMSRKRVVEEIVRRLQSPPAGLDPALPPSARLQSVQWQGTTLVLDFDAALTDPQFWQGSEVAHLRLQALVHSLTSLPQVQRVQLTVNGQPPEPLGGHEEVSEPLTPDPSLR